MKGLLLRVSSPLRSDGLTHAERFTRAVLLVAWPPVILWVIVGPSVASGGVCVFKMVSGAPCPLCGGTTSAGYLLRGEWSAAWLVHPLAVIALMMAALHSLVLLVELGQNRALVPRRWWSWPWTGWALATVVWWGWRLLLR